MLGHVAPLCPGQVLKLCLRGAHVAIVRHLNLCLNIYTVIDDTSTAASDEREAETTAAATEAAEAAAARTAEEIAEAAQAMAATAAAS